MPESPPTSFARVATVPVRGFFGGIALLFRGFRMWATSPRLMLLGALPALIVGVLYVALVITLVLNLAAVATAITPFADDWGVGWRVLLRVGVAAAIVVLAVLLLVASYSAVTLAVGDPFYERIAREVENALGGAPTSDERLWASLVRGIRTAARLAALALAVAVLVLLVGLLPLVGAIAAFVLAVGFGGWILSLELTGYAFDARGLTLRDRRRLLGARRSVALGFGVAVYLLLLVPFAAVAVMPAAVAGGTLLGRDALARAGSARGEKASAE